MKRGNSLKCPNVLFDEVGSTSSQHALAEPLVEAHDVAAIDAFAHDDEAAIAVDGRAVQMGDRRVERNVQFARRLDIGGADGQRLACLDDFDAQVGDQAEEELRLEPGLGEALTKPLVDITVGHEEGAIAAAGA